MAHYRFQRRTAVTVLLLVALASCGLTACASSSDPTGQGRSLSPQQEAVIQQKRHKASMELFNCALRHGIRLPTPTAAGVNVTGVKGRSREVIISNCYHKTLRKAEREARAERAQAEQESGRLGEGEGSSSG